ncbi:MAG: hypothetical protein ABSF54_15985 [Bryobacteraceae bacterium]|jgi:hypothetical protein
MRKILSIAIFSAGIAGRAALGRAAGSRLRDAPAVLLACGLPRPEEAALAMGRIERAGGPAVRRGKGAWLPALPA